MAGNPRKFSEKIAIQQRKLNEEQNAFQSIIAEVSRITKGDPSPEPPNLCPPGDWPRPGGSLPNVCHLSQPHMMPPTNQVVYANQWPGPSGGNCGDVEHARPLAVHVRERSPGAAGGHGHHSHIYHPYRNVSPQGVRAVSPSRQMNPEFGPHVPQQYGNPHHMYLVPPQDTNWRRTHSDPGIHSSVMHPTMPGVQPSSHSPSPSNASPSTTSIAEANPNVQNCYLDPKANLSSGHVRPRSCENVPHPPYINIHPIEPDGGAQMSISNNTGSLPDLPSSLLPAHMQAHKMEELIGAQPPPSYSQAAAFTGDVPVSAPASNALQQRHSIQLPVQYPQGGGVGGAQKYEYMYGTTQRNMVSRQPFAPESPRSASGSPNEGISVGHQLESSSSSPQACQPQSPGSPYCSLQSQMQNINILDLQNQFAGQQQGYFGGDGAGSCYDSLPNASHQHYPTLDTPQMEMPPQEQMYHSMMLQEYQEQQQQQQQQHQHQQHQQQHQHHQEHQQQHHQHQQHHQQQSQQHQHYQQQMPTNMQPSSPQGQIPNIIFTGTDGSVRHGGGLRNINGDGLYVDAAVELLSSDLRMSLDPVDLERLHGLGNEQALHIDAASEDELRRDRV